MTPAPRRVLVIITRRIGDVLLATPVLRSLKRAWPRTVIDALVFNGSEGVLAGNPDLGDILTIPERPRLLQHIDFVGKLYRRYDLAISLLPGDRPTFYAFIAGRKRVGLLINTRRQRWKRRLLHQWAAYAPEDQHTVLTYLSVLKLLDVPPATDITVSWRDTDEHAAATALAPLNNAPYVVLHIYPKFNYKLWHQTGWLALARWLNERGLRVALTGSKDPAELEYISRLCHNMPGALNLAGLLSLGACASLIKNAKAYVGIDTALTHMAAALDVPTVALFGPTDPVRWGPWPKGHAALENPWRRLGDQANQRVRLVQGVAACVPCGYEGCARHIVSFSDCLLHLPATRVIEALSELTSL